MDTPYDDALRTLRTTGRVRLRGEPTPRSRASRALMLVLVGLVGLLAVAVACVVLIAVLAWLTGRWAADAVVGAVVGALTALPLVVLGEVLLLRGLAQTRRFVDAERADVALDERGLELRGVGPVPWQDFGPAAHHMVPAEHSSGRTRRAVMPLTWSGVAHVEDRLPAQWQDRISPTGSGPVWRRRREWIYVPGAEGLSVREVMALINTGHRMYGGGAGHM